MLAAVIFGVSVLAKKHFGPLDGLCNGAMDVAPGSQSTGEVASCGLDTTLYSVASFGFWAAIVMGVLSGTMTLFALLASPASLSVLNAPTKTRRQQRAASTSRRSSASTGTMCSMVRPVTRCPRCNAPNDVHASDGPCYQCGASLAA